MSTFVTSEAFSESWFAIGVGVLRCCVCVRFFIGRWGFNFGFEWGSLIVCRWIFLHRLYPFFRPTVWSFAATSLRKSFRLLFIHFFHYFSPGNYIRKKTQRLQLDLFLYNIQLNPPMNLAIKWFSLSCRFVRAPSRLKSFVYSAIVFDPYRKFWYWLYRIYS